MSDPLLQEERRLSQLVERAKVDGPRLGHSFRPSQDEALHMAWEYALAVVALAQRVEDAEAACKRLDAENFALRAWEPENELRGKIEDAERENERLRAVVDAAYIAKHEGRSEPYPAPQMEERE